MPDYKKLAEGKLKVTFADCTFEKRYKKHKVEKMRRTIYVCKRMGCSWYMVPTLSPTECVQLVLEEDGKR